MIVTEVSQKIKVGYLNNINPSFGGIKNAAELFKIFPKLVKKIFFQPLKPDVRCMFRHEKLTTYNGIL